MEEEREIETEMKTKASSAFPAWMAAEDARSKTLLRFLRKIEALYDKERE